MKTSKGVSNRYTNYLCAIGFIKKVPQYVENAGYRDFLRMTHEREIKEPMTKNCHRCDGEEQSLIQKNVIGYTKNRQTSIQKNVIGHTKKCKTNTENTTENTTEIISSSPKPPYEATENEKENDYKAPNRIEKDTFDLKTETWIIIPENK